MRFLILFVLFCASLLGQSKPVMPIFEEEQRPIEWTELTPSPDTIQYFVDNAIGDDSFNGRSPWVLGNGVGPKRTIQAGYNQLRDGYPDFLFIKRGQTFNENIEWNKSGRSNTERMVISAYQNELHLPRPVIVPTYAAIFHFRNYQGFSNVNIMSLDVKNPNYNPLVDTSLCGFTLLGTFNNVLIEDVRTTGMGGGINMYDPNGIASQPGENVVLRRCVIVDAHKRPNIGHSQGMFTTGHKMVIEECLFDHNGWLESDPSTQTIFNHNLYVSHSGVVPITFRNSISARASSHGGQFRTGGILDNNLFYQNALSILVGSSQSTVPPNPSVVSNNVVLDAKDIYTNPRGNALDIVGGSNHLVINNIFKDRLTGSGQPAISISGSYFPVRNLNLTRNIISNWRSQSFYFSGGAGSVNQITFRQNEIYEPISQMIMDGPVYPQLSLSLYNKYYNPATQPFLVGGAYRTPTQYFSLVGDVGSTYSTTVPALQTVNLDTYYNTLRNTNTGAVGFLTEARENRKGNWDPALTAWAVNNYIRAAYGR